MIEVPLLDVLKKRNMKKINKEVMFITEEAFKLPSWFKNNIDVLEKAILVVVMLRYGNEKNIVLKSSSKELNLAKAREIMKNPKSLPLSLEEYYDMYCKKTEVKKKFYVSVIIDGCIEADSLEEAQRISDSITLYNINTLLENKEITNISVIESETT